MQLFVAVLRKLSFLFVILFCSRSSLAQDVVLSGAVATPDKVLTKGWVVIKDGRILSILEKAPDDAKGPRIESNGIIFPGFVDLHDHPMYNIFKRWSPKVKFRNRYEWRSLVDYYKLVGRPGGELQLKDDNDKNDQKFCDIDEFVEVKGLIGGTTSITGISGRGQTPPVPSCVLGLARNLDWASGFYGWGAGNERVENALGVTPGDLHEEVLHRILGELSDNKIDLLLVHVAEGAPEDLESTVEFRALKGAGLLGSHTAIIHGVALGPDQFKEMANSGTALIWSPRSNFELYGFTADVASAKKANVTMALAPDWSPTGSANSLAELRYAKQVSHEKLGDLFSDQDLFEMSTSIPARIARIDDKVGSVKKGLYADLFVLAGDVTQPYAALTHAKPEDVQLVLVGGVPIYGSEKLMAAFAVKMEEVDVCGRKMYLNAAGLVDGPLADVTTRLVGDLKPYKLDLGPLVECTK
jgi:cytosine/adenosine deaminase-related metal-dependent hydrolase